MSSKSQGDERQCMYRTRGIATQEEADRLRCAADKLDDAVSELAAVEGAGFVIMLAVQLRKGAQEIEKCLGK